MALRRWLALALVFGLSALSGADRPGARRGQSPCPDAGRRTEIRARFQASRLCQPGCAEGWDDQYRRHRHVRQLQSLHHEGNAGGNSAASTTRSRTSTEDDNLTEYGLLAESMEVAEDKSWIIFNLRPEARWHDGQPVTADDVVFTFNILVEKGSPQYRYYYADVAKVEKLGDLPRQVPVQARRQSRAAGDHGAARHPAEALVGDPQLRERAARAAAGQRSLQGRQVRHGPLLHDGARAGLLGQGSADQYRHQQLRPHPHDLSSRIRRFSSKRSRPERWISARENSARRWATQYDFPAVKDGRVIKEKIPHANPVGIQGFIFNIRKPLFADRKVREALIYAFDFEYLQQDLGVRPIYAHALLVPELRDGGKGHAVAGRAGNPEPAEGPDPAGGLHHRIQSTGDRWLRKRARQSCEGRGVAGRSRLEGRERQAGQGRQAVRIRDPGR